jgi:tetratricopeptide (TPR) repeat protein
MKNRIYKTIYVILFIIVLFLSFYNFYNIESRNKLSEFKSHNSYNLYIEAQLNYHKDYTLSESLFKKSIELNNSFQKPYLMLIHYNYVIKRDFNETLKLIDKYIFQFPQNGIGYGLKALVYLELNETNEAKKYLSKSFDNIKYNSSYDFVYLAQGWIKYNLNLFEDGEYFFNLSLTTPKILMIEEPYSFFRIEKIDIILNVLINYEQYDKAKKIIYDIFDKNNSYNIYPLEKGYPLTLYQHLANIYVKQKDYQKSKEILHKLEKLYETSDEQGMVCPYQSLGILYYHTGELDKSIDYYKKFADAIPNRPSAQIEVAQKCLEYKDFECAERYAKKVLENDKNNYDAVLIINRIKYSN